MNVLKPEQDFEPMDLIYEDNAIFYPAGEQKHYLYIVTPLCDVISVTDTDIWINLSTEWLRSIIQDIDVQYLQYRSANMTDYFKLISSLVPSVKLSPAGTYSMLKVHRRRYTELYNVDELSIGCSVRCVLSANYAKNNIIWNAVKMQCRNKKVKRVQGSGLDSGLDTGLDLGLDSGLDLDSDLDSDMSKFLQECQLHGRDQRLIRIG
jgi:hypothetical protein